MNLDEKEMILDSIDDNLNQIKNAITQDYKEMMIEQIIIKLFLWDILWKEKYIELKEKYTQIANQILDDLENEDE